MNIAVFPYNFPPLRGGIHTWLYSICKNFTTDRVTCIVEKAENAEKFDQQQEFKIIRSESEADVTFTLLIKKLFIVLAFFYRYVKPQNISFKSIVLGIKVFNSMNYMQINYIVQNYFAWISKGDAGNENFVLCGTVLPVGIIAFLHSLFFKKPYAVLAHGQEILSWKTSKKYAKLLKIIYQNAYLVVANSHYTKSLLLDFVEDEKIQIIHPGANKAVFFPKPKSVHLLKKYNLNQKTVLLTTSHLVERKGHDYVLKAIANLIKNFPDLVYLIVGRGPNRNRLEFMTRKLGIMNSVIFAGYIKDELLVDYYNLCDIFIMPSRITGNSVEGFGIAYIEANACGKPVIGGHAGGVPDAVLHEQTGLLVDPVNTAEIETAIRKLLQPDYANTLGVNGKNRVQNELNWKDSAQKLRNAIKV